VTAGDVVTTVSIPVRLICGSRLPLNSNAREIAG
jgi:hypothetical protein